MATKKTDMLTSPHVDGAKLFIDRLRAMRDDFPRFVTDGVEATSRLNGLQVPDDFMESVSVAVDVSKRLADAGATDAVTLRDSYGYAIAYEMVVQEALAFARFVAHTIRMQRAEAASSALDVYAIAQRISKQKGGADLIPYVDDMRRKLHKTRSRKAAAESAPAPVAVKP